MQMVGEVKLPLAPSLGRCEMVRFDPSSYQRASATDTFRIEARMFLGYAGRGQRTDQPARGTPRRGAGDSTDRRRDQPTGRHYRTDAGDGEHTQTGKQTRGPPIAAPPAAPVSAPTAAPLVGSSVTT
jgi:hypothetical protein